MANTEKSNSETLAETIKAIFDPLNKQLHDLEAAIPETEAALRKIEGSLKVEDVKHAALLQAQLEALKSAHLKAQAAIETAKTNNYDKPAIMTGFVVYLYAQRRESVFAKKHKSDISDTLKKISVPPQLPNKT